MIFDVHSTIQYIHDFQAIIAVTEEDHISLM